MPPKLSAQERVGVALGDEPLDLLEERPPERRAGDEHLPAGLDAHAGVDEELGELTIPGICHAREYIRRTYCFVKSEPCPA